MSSALAGWNPLPVVGDRQSLETASPEHAQALRELMGPLLGSITVKRHCVRCHSDYFDAGNHREACVVLCGEGDINDEYDNDEPLYEVPCCGKFLDECDYRCDQVCYTAKHTADPRDVRYAKGCDTEEEEGLDYTGSNENVVTCRSQGCKFGKSKKRLAWWVGFYRKRPCTDEMVRFNLIEIVHQSKVYSTAFDKY
jgi:hypothetical protein